MMSRERLGGVVMLAISLFYGAQISDIQQLPVDALEAMNARTLPVVICGVGVVLSVLLILLGAPANSALPKGEVVNELAKAQKSVTPRDLVTVVVLLVWTLAYGWLLPWLGFWLATSAFLFAGFWLLGASRRVMALAVALLLTTALWAVLRFGLGLYLPPGSVWLAL